MGPPLHCLGPSSCRTSNNSWPQDGTSPSDPSLTRWRGPPHRPDRRGLGSSKARPPNSALQLRRARSRGGFSLSAACPLRHSTRGLLAQPRRALSLRRARLVHGRSPNLQEFLSRWGPANRPAPCFLSYAYHGQSHDTRSNTTWPMGYNMSHTQGMRGQQWIYASSTYK